MTTCTKLWTRYSYIK